MFDLWKLGAAGGAALILVTSCVVRDHSIGAKKAAEIKGATTHAASKAIQKQSAVPRDGAFSRVQSEFCPGCTKP